MSSQRRIKAAATPYLLLLPAMLVTFLIVFYPIGRSVVISLHFYVLTRLQSVRFIGLSNYLRALEDPIFWISLMNSVTYVISTVTVQFVVGFIAALLLNQKFRGRGIIRAMMLIPWVTPGVLTAFMWSWLYDGNYGVINGILEQLHIISAPIPWLAQPNTALAAIIVATIWQGIPFFAVMLLAALQAVPEELYEAAQIDGASPWQEFWQVTVPQVFPTIVTTTLLRTIWVSNYVDIIYVMTAGGPGYSSLTLPVYTFMTARSSLNYGYASTLSMFLTMLLLTFVWLYTRSVKKAGVTIR